MRKEMCSAHWRWYCALECSGNAPLQLVWVCARVTTSHPSIRICQWKTRVHIQVLWSAAWGFRSVRKGSFQCIVCVWMPLPMTGIAVLSTYLTWNVDMHVLTSNAYLFSSSVSSSLMFHCNFTIVGYLGVASVVSVVAWPISSLTWHKNRCTNRTSAVWPKTNLIGLWGI